MKKVLLGLALLILAAAVFGCTKQERGNPATGPATGPAAGETAGEIKVVTTILPVADFIQNVGGDRVKVVVMVPPGADPHTYEPAPGRMSELAGARAYFAVGSGVEFELAWLEKIKQNYPALAIVDCSRGIPLLDLDTPERAEKMAEGAAAESGQPAGGNLSPERMGHPEHHESEHRGKDPHIWLSPKNAQIMVENIYAGLGQIDPAHKADYLRNRDAYLRELTELDEKIAGSLQRVQNRNFLVFHPAWGYFARDYGLREIPVEAGGKEPGAKELARIIATAKKENIRTVFASPQFNPQSARAIAREIRGRVIFIDPLPQKYIPNLLQVVGQFE